MTEPKGTHQCLVFLVYVQRNYPGLAQIELHSIIDMCLNTFRLIYLDLMQKMAKYVMVLWWGTIDAESFVADSWPRYL